MCVEQSVSDGAAGDDPVGDDQKRDPGDAAEGRASFHWRSARRRALVPALHLPVDIEIGRARRGAGAPGLRLRLCVASAPVRPGRVEWDTAGAALASCRAVQVALARPPARSYELWRAQGVLPGWRGCRAVQVARTRPPARPCELRRAQGVLSGWRGCEQAPLRQRRARLARFATAQRKRLAAPLVRPGALKIPGWALTSTVASLRKRLAPQLARFGALAIGGAWLSVAVAPQRERPAAELERLLVGQVERRFLGQPLGEMECCSPRLLSGTQAASLASAVVVPALAPVAATSKLQPCELRRFERCGRALAASARLCRPGDV